jgi:argininosuccinate lyase
MITQVSGGGGGWGNYVKYGTKHKPRDHNHVKILKGDIDFGDKVVNAGKWKQNAYHLVLGFKGRISEEKAKEILEDFEHHFGMTPII